ncbi:MAG: bifunctional phosphoribosyl-AMP cyclohydrolase/phosphoribosyl-ATP diphosphatase HisIE [Brotaphodocola sp.]
MADFKRLIAAVGCKEGNAIFLNDGCVSSISLKELAHHYNNNGADGLLIWDCSETDDDHEAVIGQIKELAREIDISILTGGRVKRLEDVKKYLYAGAKAVVLDGANETNIDLIKEASDRFGSEKIYVKIADEKQLKRMEEFEQLGASGLVLDSSIFSAAMGSHASDLQSALILLISDGTNEDAFASCMKEKAAGGMILTAPELADKNFMEIKQNLAEQGIAVDVFHASMEWNQFKTNSDGLVPVIVQDYKTSEVLMLAYMNEQAYLDTIRTGKMHYYSRSRQAQWMKGETSGHFQYVKSLKLDCDNDTMLAKVHQIGPACHTGSRSCFFQTLTEKEYKETNPLKVFEHVFQVILDRKAHPKEGSYTNYLFDKGIDKILKKVGEEATEIVIAAKNPDPEEIKYEISDFLYHVMVLMAVKGVTWEEITEELANR